MKTPPPAAAGFLLPSVKRRAVLTATALTLTTTVAFAQSTSGDLSGRVAGQSGATVTIENTDTKLTRSTTVDGSGSYGFSKLPVGSYRITISKDGKETASRDVDINAGVSSTLNIGAEQVLNRVRVTGQRTIDVNSSESSVSLSAKRLREIPVARDASSVALLAPGVVKGDSRFAQGGVSLPTFSGGTAAENTYYVNGFNVTNLFQSLAYSQVPFEAIASQQLITGGYGPEYGFATGGVINIVTKRGSNQWKAGANVFWEPGSLAESSPDIYDSDGRIIDFNSGETSSKRTGAFWLGGPIVKDTLYVYGIFQQEIRKNLTYDARSGTSTQVGRNIIASNRKVDSSTRNPYSLVKVDWNLNEKNLVEFTAFDDKSVRTRQISSTAYPDAAFDGDTPQTVKYLGAVEQEFGGTSKILKYTGYFADNVTFSTIVGEEQFKRGYSALGANGVRASYNGVVGDLNQPGCSAVGDTRAIIRANEPARSRITTCNFAGRVSIPNAEDERKSYRADLEWKLAENMQQYFGKHTFKIGLDQDNFTSVAGSTGEGGASYSYRTNTRDTTESTAGTNYVRVSLAQRAARLRIETQGYYLKDDWMVLDDVMLSLGVRSDSFTNYNGSGVAYVSQKNILQPRIGGVWDVKGDQTMKAFFNYGQYSLPIVANAALRGVSGSILSSQDFYYDGIDTTTGKPQNLQEIPDAQADNYSFPDIFYINGEVGTTPNPATAADSDLRPFSQTETILGFEAEVMESLTAGIRYVHRDLDNAIDDICDPRIYRDYAIRNGFANVRDLDEYLTVDGNFNGGCQLINPGRSINVLHDVNQDGTLEKVSLTPAEIGLPKAKRKYDAVELTAEKNWAHQWFANVSYTWSHSYGNSEGLIDSVSGQADTGTTASFDFREIQVGGYGLLPNDRRHTVKLYGAYRPLDELLLGANFTAQSGRPYGCLGYPGSDVDVLGYGVNYHQCGGQLTPPGSAGKTPWSYNLDLTVNYKPKFVKGLQLSADVFNVLNLDTVLALEEYGEDDSTPPVASSAYKAPLSYQTPRYVRVGLQYDFAL